MSTSQPAIRFTLRQLQYFAAVARTGQISLAAAQAHVTQSTMTAAIAELERVLGTMLFERGRSGVTLTYEGHLFLQRAQAVIEAATDAARHPFQDRGTVSGTLQLAASYTVLGYFLLPFIAKFQKLYPEARIVPVERDREHIEAGIESGELELAVALTSNLLEPRRFQRPELARSRRQLWAAVSHPLAELSLASLEDVAPYPYILPAVDEGDVAAMRYWDEAGMQPESFVRTTSMEAVREMVALGLGVTILSDMVFRPWSLDGRRIQTVPLKNPIPPMEVGLVWRKGQRLGPVASALCKYLEVSVGAPGGD
ncbi:LysR family transcriptional regulator [Azohydromonas caseinilytica]|uniref:LysR family transcriptional regulator n=1 Tax=Azohydromonas caseinilytica TaxID=2728836 RepID=A0A848FIH1_9BURK|nr:LysR family transcriptional regulator [Azohydromonas caseinilytica]NML19074.1 LysR family transcriptional regulator [Azohydromonas caseinilytica]